ncbi:squalene monooxygenase [Piedraia hortae CBS 480.64]|uniref:Squalene monooxygenase n=1 Tax=Piedraia hortae CBS 480.64 TaxID=1314780 RepID=A0A6A7C6N0_9PEZI|nr:squalene monooxygenase [Piedraia hortae CBS 480.64]
MDPCKIEKLRLHHHEADVVVVGAGIFGCAIAVALANQGRSVVVVERSLKQPDRIVGELLQPGGVSALRQLGLGECLEGIDAIPVLGYDVIYHQDSVVIPYPCPSGKATAQGPQGRSFHHGRFISRLRERLNHPNISVFEGTATEPITSSYTGHAVGIKARLAGLEEAFFAPLTVIADGYASKFRAHVRHDKPLVRSRFYGLELYDVTLPVPHHGHVILTDGPPVLLYQIGTRETRALIDVPESLPSAKVKDHLKDTVLPSLPANIQAEFAAAIERDRRSMPNSFLPPVINKTPGLVLLGDAMNMRHPLTGGGMTVALNDALLLSTLLEPLPNFEDRNAVSKIMQKFHWQRKNLASVINILAQALYSLFAANDNQLRALQRGCFYYFKRGGNCVDGPVGLLAGIIRQPIVLIWHFFAVAVYAMWLYVVKGSVSLMPLRIMGSLGVLWKACAVIGPWLVSEAR